jgi:hypothetical protein
MQYPYNVRVWVLTTALLKIQFFWDVTLCHLECSYWVLTLETTHPTKGAPYPWRIYSSPFHCISHTRFGAKTIQMGEQSLRVPWKKRSWNNFTTNMVTLIKSWHLLNLVSKNTVILCLNTITCNIKTNTWSNMTDQGWGTGSIQQTGWRQTVSGGDEMDGNAHCWSGRWVWWSVSYWMPQVSEILHTL